LKAKNQKWRRYPNTLILENRWQAQRHGVTGDLIDWGRGEMVGFASLAEELVALVSEEAAALGSLKELRYLNVIAKNGPSAVRQRRVHRAAMQRGESHEGAMKAVVAYLVEGFASENGPTPSKKDEA